MLVLATFALLAGDAIPGLSVDFSPWSHRVPGRRAGVAGALRPLPRAPRARATSTTCRGSSPPPRVAAMSVTFVQVLFVEAPDAATEMVRAWVLATGLLLAGRGGNGARRAPRADPRHAPAARRSIVGAGRVGRLIATAPDRQARGRPAAARLRRRRPTSGGRPRPRGAAGSSPSCRSSTRAPSSGAIVQGAGHRARDHRLLLVLARDAARPRAAPARPRRDGLGRPAPLRGDARPRRAAADGRPCRSSASSPRRRAAGGCRSSTRSTACSPCSRSWCSRRC